jgi:PucR family transcriptional regulator, purine catabolism regulatory protein
MPSAARLARPARSSPTARNWAGTWTGRWRVAGLPAAYDQARKALLAGRRTRGPGGVTHFDRLGVHRLLSLVADDGELRSFAADVLGPLAADRGDAAGLRRTLQVLLDANCNVAEAARLLHFHYNTLRYRIGKLEAMVGPFTSDPHLRLDVALALRVLHMRGLAPARDGSGGGG